MKPTVSPYLIGIGIGWTFVAFHGSLPESMMLAWIITVPLVIGFERTIEQ